MNNVAMPDANEFNDFNLNQDMYDDWAPTDDPYLISQQDTYEDYEFEQLRRDRHITGRLFREGHWKHYVPPDLNVSGMIYLNEADLIEGAYGTVDPARTWERGLFEYEKREAFKLQRQRDSLLNQIGEKLPDLDMDQFEALLNQVQTTWTQHLVAAHSEQYARRIEARNLQLMNDAIDNYGATGENLTNMLNGLEDTDFPATIEMTDLRGRLGEEIEDTELYPYEDMVRDIDAIGNPADTRVREPAGPDEFAAEREYARLEGQYQENALRRDYYEAIRDNPEINFRDAARIVDPSENRFDENFEQLFNEAQEAFHTGNDLTLVRLDQPLPPDQQWDINTEIPDAENLDLSGTVEVGRDTEIEMGRLDLGDTGLDVGPARYVEPLPGDIEMTRLGEDLQDYFPEETGGWRITEDAMLRENMEQALLNKGTITAEQVGNISMGELNNLAAEAELDLSMGLLGMAAAGHVMMANYIMPDDTAERAYRDAYQRETQQHDETQERLNDLGDTVFVNVDGDWYQANVNARKVINWQGFNMVPAIDVTVIAEGNPHLIVPVRDDIVRIDDGTWRPDVIATGHIDDGTWRPTITPIHDDRPLVDGRTDINPMWYVDPLHLNKFNYGPWLAKNPYGGGHLKTKQLNKTWTRRQMAKYNYDQVLTKRDERHQRARERKAYLETYVHGEHSGRNTHPLDGNGTELFPNTRVLIHGRPAHCLRLGGHSNQGDFIPP